jgi:hypothetical protein
MLESTISADRCGSRRERIGGRLRAGEEFFESFARLLEACFRHRSHVLRNLESLMFLFRHDRQMRTLESDRWVRLSSL